MALLLQVHGTRGKYETLVRQRRTKKRSGAVQEGRRYTLSDRRIKEEIRNIGNW